MVTGCLLTLSSFPQNNVTLKVNGNKNRKVLVDGKTYAFSNTNPKANNKNVTITTLQPGEHTLQVFRTKAGTNTGVTTFTLRDGYDMMLTVNGSGAVQLKEKQRPVATPQVNTSQNGMTSDNYNRLINDVRAQWQAGAKLDMIGKAFSDPVNFFTTAQAKQLVQMIDAEDSRLQLAKASYRSITDPGNFNSIYSLLAKQSSKNELSAFISSYNSSNTAMGMNNTDFTILVQQVQNQWQAGGKLDMISNAFTNSGAYFTVAQAKQLVQMIDAEDSRLMLAKASYKTITDPVNFNNMYSLLNTQQARNELSAYVSNYQAGGGTVTNMAMSSAAFDKLLHQVQDLWQASSRYNAITNAFNAGNYFTAAQARQLVQMVDAEGSRLQLAKLAYKTVTDPANYNTVAELLNNENSRNELAAYIRTGNGTTTAPITAMSDADFQSVLTQVKSQWVPGGKMMVLQDVFAKTTNYFSTAQARQLVGYVTVEDNKLQLLKLSYRNITDKYNFSSLYDVLTTQSSRDELANYVNSYTTK